MHQRAFRLLLRGSLVVTCLLGLSAMPAAASSLERRSLSDLVKGSELVFEGEVVSSTVVPPTVAGRPAHTCVTFHITDIISGTHPSDSVTLCFLGGQIDGQGTVVSDMSYPVVGEHGIYLTESTGKAMVNPLAGWDQGHFLIEKDPVSGSAKVMTAHRRPILDIAAEAGLPTGEASLMSADATAKGVVAGDGPDIKGAMGRDQFKAWLKSVR